MEFKSLLYNTSPDGKITYITLNCPNQHNAIDQHMPLELHIAVQTANTNPKVHCIVLKGTSCSFCSSYNLNIYTANAQYGQTAGSQDLTQGYKLFQDYSSMKECTNCYSELFHSYKPTIAQVHGAAVAGGSDITLCCNLVVMVDDVRIGYPPSCVWGCLMMAMWAYQVGVEKVKRMLFTGDLISGSEAVGMGLILKAVPAVQLEETVSLLTERIKSVPVNQLWMQ